MDDRKFTNREVREIVKRAVADTTSRDLAEGEGLSLTELKVIGQEVGIDPGRLEDAARAVALEGGGRSKGILGGPTFLNVERRVDGEMDPRDTPEVLSIIRRTMGHAGELTEIHGSLEWSASTEWGERHVTLASRDGRTTIQGSANLATAAAVVFILLGGVGFIVSILGLREFVIDGGLAGLILCLVVFPILYPLLRTILSRISRAESAKLQRVVDELAGLTGGSAE